MPRLQLISLSGTKFDDEVYEIVLPTMAGEIGVLHDHMPLVTISVPGAIAVRRQPHDGDGRLEYFAASGGVIDIENNIVRVLVDEADLADEISVYEARAAHERALQMKREAKDQISLEHAQELIDRTSVRLYVAGLRRRH